eukprot:gene5960-12030_t
MVASFAKDNIFRVTAIMLSFSFISSHTMVRSRNLRIFCSMVDDRMKLTSQNAVSNTMERFKEKCRCQTCWLHKSICICDSVRLLAANSPPLKINVALLMHYKEYGRASNTGKLLSILAPTKTSITIFGSDEATALYDSLLTKPSLVLYPGADSKPASDYKDWCQNSNEEITLCVMDSTWNLSKAMERSIPEGVPRVNINTEVTGPSLFLSRKQSTTASKVSTIEAILLALTSLGEDPAALASFIPALKLSVDVVQRQRGRPNLYGTVIEPQDLGDDNPSQYCSVTKPDCCPSCGNTDGNFRNLGTIRQPEGELSRLRLWKCKSCNENFNTPLSSSIVDVIDN